MTRICDTPGTTYHVYRGGKTVSWESTLEQCRLAAETHAAALRNNSMLVKEASMFRFFRFHNVAGEAQGVRFMMAYLVTADGKVVDWPDVSIAAESW